ncbi:hypothetical protein R3P38DRAFT_2950029 [Favolaschia claudopus]|uniref:Uncharacterized protein n=1 Tax=Favolaschia claudopus TaxID=2862362 RepID=A0AAW0BHJ3_9AGAR
MHRTIETIRDAETTLVKLLAKSKGKGGVKPVSYDPKKPKKREGVCGGDTSSLVAGDGCVQGITESYDDAS